MGFRDTIRNNPTVGAAVALVVIVVAAWMAMKQLKPRETPRPTGQWFYNLQTGQLFVADKEAVPPIEAPDGSEAVRAKVYGCGSCKEADRKGVVLEKFPPEVVKTLRSPLPVDPNSTEAGSYQAQRDRLTVDALLIALPPPQPGGQVKWVPLKASEAAAVTAAAESLCGDRPPRICTPP